jgi:GNAT superfamily N-acetyltransferase
VSTYSNPASISCFASSTVLATLQTHSSSLIKYIEGEARKLGFRRLRVPYVDMNADWAINFYKKFGFRIVEKREKPWGFDLFFEKKLE